jgi:iron complex transport system substrate-binding protein
VSRLDWASAAWLVLVLAGVAAVGGSATSDAAPAPAAASGDAASSVRDAAGRELAVRPYRRIVSSSLLADQLLLELAEPERVLAFSRYAKKQHPERQRFPTRLPFAGPGDLERLLEARVDLLLVNNRGAENQLARAREAGIAVFDLGEMRGLATLQTSMSSLARLLGDGARGERLWQRFSRRMRAVAGDIPRAQRKPALYLATYSGKLFGGTRGTSFHDVLEAAGLIDLAATRYRDWPQYDPEQVLELDPPLIVTSSGMARELCAGQWLAPLRACRERERRVIELPAVLLDDPGLLMLDAAEALHALAYPLRPNQPPETKLSPE